MLSFLTMVLIIWVIRITIAILSESHGDHKYFDERVEHLVKIKRVIKSLGWAITLASLAVILSVTEFRPEWWPIPRYESGYISGFAFFGVLFGSFLWGALVEVIGRTPLIKATIKKDVDAVKELLTKGENPNLRSASGSTPLSVCNQIEILQLLLRHGADPNIQGLNGYTALANAATEGHEEIAKILLLNGADPNKKDIIGSTPLIVSALYNHIDIIKLLVTHGADLNIQNDEGCTALMCASRYGHEEIVKILFSNGADPSKRNLEGDSALRLASFHNHKSIIKILE